MLSYAAGDLGAFKELYRRHSQGLYKFVKYLSPSEAWVDDIVQDTWNSLHQTRERKDSMPHFRAYIYRIARNRLVDEARKQKNLVSINDPRLHGNDEDSDDGFLGLQQDNSSYGENPESSLEQKQTTDRLNAAIGNLPDVQKEALILQHFCGLSLDEISEVSKTPVETIKSRVRYAFVKLRKCLNDSTQQEQCA